eukprot:UN12584
MVLPASDLCPGRPPQGHRGCAPPELRESRVLHAALLAQLPLAGSTPDRAPWKLSLVPNVTAKMEPGAGTWSKPIDDYMSPDITGTMLEVTQEIPKGIRIKADFIGEPNAHASNTWVAGYRSDD